MKKKLYALSTYTHTSHTHKSCTQTVQRERYAIAIFDDDDDDEDDEEEEEEENDLLNRYNYINGEKSSNS